ncbi:PREDICTED: ephrin-A3 isoform X2 [Myotis brandtii]|uniref:ephrin-A3 isoform X2 n=1 Tax=Myotis brandtii TaxID=109478 RepID=UPI0007040651|nr:PREDICTED: ephrin-A3 isoform X2 [Myotis brandtii]
MMEERIENCLKGQVPPSPQIPARPTPYRGRGSELGRYSPGGGVSSELLGPSVTFFTLKTEGDRVKESAQAKQAPGPSSSVAGIAGTGPSAPSRTDSSWAQPFHNLRREGYTVQVNVNDYLDIYCPHYNSSGPGGGAEQYVLYMVSRAGYRSCNASQGFKRWECNRPHASHSPIKFSEKFQRYSAFSLGYEFHAGHVSSPATPTHNLHWKCLRMKVFVCCASKDFEGENPQVPKLEKSISGTSPKREHLPLAVGIAFFLMTLLAS